MITGTDAGEQVADIHLSWQVTWTVQGGRMRPALDEAMAINREGCGAARARMMALDH